MNISRRLQRSRSKSNVALLVLPLLLTMLQTSAQKTLNVGIVSDCQSARSMSYAQQIVSEAQTLLGDKYQITTLQENILQGDCTKEQAEANLKTLLNDPDIDLVLGVDVITSHVMASNGPYDKPVLASAVLNAQVQGIPVNSKGASGVKNLAYLELPLSPPRDMEVFQEIIGFNKLAVIIDEAVFTGIPEIRRFFEEGLADLGVESSIIFSENTAAETLNKITNEDAVYLLPSNRLTDAEFQNLIDGINDKKLKSFSILGRLDVDRGVLAGVAPASNLSLFTRRMGINIQRISNDEKPEKFSVRVNQKEELVFNMATARQIDYSPSWDLLIEAVLLNEDREDIDRSINIFNAIEEALANNLNIEIAEKDVEVAQKEVDIARSRLLPEVSAGASHTIVDEDLASISNGQNPENRGQGNLQLGQIIYSEQVTANKKIQEYLLEGQEASLQGQVLDVVLQVSTTYLQLMQAKTLEKIQRQNLDLTRKNLELARTGSAIGQTGPSDLYRWQGEIANAKGNLLNASAQRRQAEIAVNQILNRPIDELFLTEEIDINDSRYVINNERLSSFINNPRDFGLFKTFMVQQAFEYSPDLVQLGANVKAQERSLLLNRRNQYIPQVSLGANYNYELYRNGAGSEVPPPFQAPNDWNWNISIGASLPIFQSGRRKYQVQQSQVQLSQIQTQRTNLERLVEQQVRSELENVRASFFNIDLARQAEEAVVKNFEIIQDAYSQGAVLITQVLDAQNAAVSAQLNSANVVYQFLIDLLTMERAVGNYYMLMTEEQRRDYEAQVASYFSQQ